MSQDLEHNEDHQGDVEDLFAEQFKGTTSLRALVDAFTGRTQEAEDVFQELWRERGIDVAVGDQLDGLGTIVGQARLGLDDDDYRVRIKTRIRVNQSSGLASDIFAVSILLLGTNDPPMALEEYPPAAIVVRLDEYVNASPSVLAEVISETRAVCVDAQLTYLAALASLTFSFSDTAASESSTSLGFADDAQTTGGQLADVIEA